MIKKTVSIIGFVMLTFCFGLGMAGFISTNANAGEGPPGPPLPNCIWQTCHVDYASDCIPGKVRTITWTKTQGSQCCGTSGPPSGCHFPY